METTTNMAHCSTRIKNSLIWVHNYAIIFLAKETIFANNTFFDWNLFSVNGKLHVKNELYSDFIHTRPPAPSKILLRIKIEFWVKLHHNLYTKRYSLNNIMLSIRQIEKAPIYPPPPSSSITKTHSHFFVLCTGVYLWMRAFIKIKCIVAAELKTHKMRSVSKERDASCCWGAITSVWCEASTVLINLPCPKSSIVAFVYT